MNSGGASDLTSSCSSPISSGRVVLCTEVFDDKSEPSQEEVFEYAQKLGIDPKCEPHLLYLAKEGLLQHLPSHWKPCWDPNVEDYYYYNSKSGESQWKHPLDEVYRQKVVQAKMDMKPPAKLAPLPSVAAKKALPPLKKLGSPNKPLTKSDALLLEDSVRSQSPAPPEVQPQQKRGKIKGILKQQKEDDTWRQQRAQEVENEKRRIQFDLKKELSNEKRSPLRSQPSINITVDEPSDLDKSTPDSDHDEDDEDFMSRHSLFDPEDLIVDDETLGEIDNLVKEVQVEQSQDVVKEEEPIEEPQPKTRTKLSKILSSVTSEQPIVVKQVSKSSEESADETLGSVKFGTATTDLVASAKSEMSRPDSGKDKELVKRELSHIGQPLMVAQDRPEIEVSKEVEAFESQFRAVLEKEKRKIEADLKLSFQTELATLKEALTREHAREEAEIREAFTKEVARLRASMQEDLDHEKDNLIHRFNTELGNEMQRLQKELEEKTAAKKEQISSSIPNPETSKVGESVGMDHLKRQLKAELASDIGELSKSINLLRSQIEASASKTANVSPEYSNLEEPPRRDFRGSSGNLKKSRSNLNIDSDADSLYDASNLDLNRSLWDLQHRVLSLERSLKPISLPYHVPQPLAHQLPTTLGSSDMQLIGQYLAAATAPRTGHADWTVEEQIYKSKMWLKQRNQNMLSKP